MSALEAWGATTAFHAALPRSEGGPVGVAPGKTELDLFLRKLLEAYQARERTDRAFRQWNQIVREHVRAETALKLSVGDEQRSVPVKVVDGLPKPFADAVRSFDDEMVWWLALRLPALKEAGDLLDQIVARFPAIALALFEGELPFVGVREVNGTRQLLKQLATWQRAQELLTRIRAINTDVLGAYFFRRREIHLYWMVIGVVARTLGMPTEDLAVVVLAHEMAHAYTHLGRDIDDQEWGTENYARADQFIVEGLAQFYTRAVCKRLESRQPGPKRAFEALLKGQPKAYTCFEGWAKDHPQCGEIVRFAMIDARSRGITAYGEFTAKLAATAESLRKGKA